MYDPLPCGRKSTQRQGYEPGLKQIFLLADDLPDNQRKDLAWASYNLLRNTTTVALLVWHSGRVVGARGFWDIVKESDAGSSQPLRWLEQKLGSKSEDFSNLKEPFYSTNANALGWDIIPRGAASVLVQPFDTHLDKNDPVDGFLLLVSNTPRGYSGKDRDWIAFLARKLSKVL